MTRNIISSNYDKQIACTLAVFPIALQPNIVQLLCIHILPVTLG